MKGERLLIVEDKGTVSYLLTQRAQEENHLVVGKAARVAQVRAFLESGLDITVAIIDQNLPDGSGDEVARLIREKYPEVWIVSFGHKEQKWGDINLSKEGGWTASQVIEKINALESGGKGE